MRKRSRISKNQPAPAATTRDVMTTLQAEYSAKPIEIIDTGSEILNVILGRKGCPAGAFIDWTAPPGVGKSTGALFMCRKYCEQGFTVMFLDVESGVNESQLDGIGLAPYLFHPQTNPNGRFGLLEPHTFTAVDRIFAEITQLAEPPKLVVLDSITMLLSEKMEGTEVEDVQPAAHARLVSTLLRKWKHRFHQLGITLLMINQVRVQLDFNNKKFPAKIEGAGGFGYKHMADIMVKMKESEKLEREIPGTRHKRPYGSIVEISNIKNRWSLTGHPLEMAIIFGKGISNSYSYVQFLQKCNVITLNGPWYTLDFYPDREPVKVLGMLSVEEYVTKHFAQAKKLVKDRGGFDFAV